MERFTIKRGATSPELRVEVVDEDGDRYELSDVAEVWFRLYDRSMQLVFEKAAELLNAYTLQYNWESADTDREPGMYYGEFRVIFGSGEVMILPTDGWIEVVIR